MAIIVNSESYDETSQKTTDNILNNSVVKLNSTQTGTAVTASKPRLSFSIANILSKSQVLKNDFDETAMSLAMHYKFPIFAVASNASTVSPQFLSSVTSLQRKPVPQSITGLSRVDTFHQQCDTQEINDRHSNYRQELCSNSAKVNRAPLLQPLFLANAGHKRSRHDLEDDKRAYKSNRSRVLREESKETHEKHTKICSLQENGKAKRVRTIFTPEQLERLESEFERQQYMVGPERLYLAAALNLTEAQVKVWFQNRRIKWRKQHLEMQQAKIAKFKSCEDENHSESDESEPEIESALRVQAIECSPRTSDKF